MRRFRIGNLVQQGDILLDRPAETEMVVRETLRGGAFVVHGGRMQGKSTLVACCAANALRCERTTVVRIDLSGIARNGTFDSIESWTDDLCDAAVLCAERAAIKLRDPGADGRASAYRLRELFSTWYSSDRDLDRVLFVLDEFDHSSEMLRRHAKDRAISLPSFLRAVCAEIDVSRTSICVVALRPPSIEGDGQLGSTSALGAEIEVEDFSRSESTTRGLAEEIGGSNAEAIVDLLWETTGGQPFVTIAIADRIQRERPATLELAKDLIADEIEAAARSRRQIATVADTFVLDGDATGFDSWQVLAAYEQVLVGTKVYARREQRNAPENALHLWGLCRRETDDSLVPKGRYFERLFDLEWVTKMRRALELKNLRRRSASKFTPTGKVYVINTGGTLGMVRRPERGGVVEDPKDFAEFIGQFPEVLPYLADGEQPFARDSINVTPEDWVHIVGRIKDVHRRHPDYLFVVVHGTDTLAFTAAAVAFAFGPALDFPIVFTGSQTTPDVAHGDARTNLLRACMAAERRIPEVTVAFGDSLHRAVRARKRDERRFAGFESVGIPPLADLSERVEVRPEFERALAAANSSAGPEPLELPPPGFASFSRRVMTIQLVPGLEPSFYSDQLDPARCRGVEIQVLGAGNVTSRDEYSFHDFIAKAALLDIPVLLTSRFPWRPTMAAEYKPAAAAQKLGAIPAGMLTQEAASVKFRWAIAFADSISDRVKGDSRRAEIVRRIMAADFVGETLAGDAVGDEVLAGATT